MRQGFDSVVLPWPTLHLFGRRDEPINKTKFVSSAAATFRLSGLSGSLVKKRADQFSKLASLISGKIRARAIWKCLSKTSTAKTNKPVFLLKYISRTYLLLMLSPDKDSQKTVIVESELRLKTKIEPELVLAAASSSLGSVFQRYIGGVLQDL